MDQRIENGVGVFWMEDGMLRCVVKPTTAVQALPEAEDSMRIFRELAEGRARPAVIDISAAKGLSREARNAYVGPGAVGVFASAGLVVASSVIARTLGNFVINVSKPPFPVRLFESVEDALAWTRALPRSS